MTWTLVHGNLLFWMEINAKEIMARERTETIYLADVASRKLAWDAGDHVNGRVSPPRG